MPRPKRLLFKLTKKNWSLTPRLVTNAGDEMCWSPTVGDMFEMGLIDKTATYCFFHQHRQSVTLIKFVKLT